MTLTQAPLPAESVKGTEEGWIAMFDELAAALDVGCGYGQESAPRTLRFERLLPGPIERVWAYLTQSDKRAQWLASGEMAGSLGGTTTWHFDHASLSPHVTPIPAKYAAMQGGHDIHPRLTRYEPPHVLGFIWDEARDASEVVFELSQVGERVRLVLTQTRLSDRETMISAASGWHAHLTILAARLNDRTPPPFWPAHAELETAYGARLPNS
jgi:uncharacterized protein YndB with AHSA1/START domain